MQYTGSSLESTAHDQNVKRKYAKQITSSSRSSRRPSATAATIFHQSSRRKCELLSSESDISSIQIQLRKKVNGNRNSVHSGYVRRKVRWNSALGTLLLVLIGLVVNLELVFGALPLNYNSVNYYENLSYAVARDDSDIAPFLVDDASLAFNLNHIEERPSSRPSVIYQNEFAVFIPDGIERANQIAEKHGFTNTGQVRKLMPSSSSLPPS